MRSLSTTKSIRPVGEYSLRQPSPTYSYQTRGERELGDRREHIRLWSRNSVGGEEAPLLDQLLDQTFDQCDGVTKSGRARKVDLSKRLRRALREWRMAQPENPKLILPSLDQSNFRNRTFAAICAGAGIAGHHPKDLRDTFASWLLTLTGDLGYVSNQLGHADVQVTARHYARWIPTALRGQRLSLDVGDLPPDLLSRIGASESLRRQRA